VKDKVASTVLAAVLIVGELALAHHALDLSNHTIGESCELCLQSVGLDQALEHNRYALEIRPVHGLAGHRQVPVNRQSSTATFLARAPPEFLST
jgi:hypothetical protein